jgi:O-antigen ligase
VLKDFRDGATLSHTTILTIAAELGILGLAALAAVWAALIGKLFKLYTMAGYKALTCAIYLTIPLTNTLRAPAIFSGFWLYLSAPRGKGAFSKTPCSG